MKFLAVPFHLLIALILTGCVNTQAGRYENQANTAIENSPRLEEETEQQRARRAQVNETLGTELTAVSKEDDVEWPRLITTSHPELNAEERRQLGRGTIEVTFVVEENGNTTKARIVSSTNPRLNEKAIESVLNFKFTGGRINGKPSRFAFTIPIIFD